MSAGNGGGSASGRVWTAAAVAVAAGALGAGMGAAAAALAFVWRRAWGRTGGDDGSATTTPAPPSSDDQAHIAVILALWFGGGDVEDSYRHKWFCSPGSARQREFDAQIHDAFAPLLLSLYHDDRRTAHQWRSSPRGTLALIVLFDQLARHIHRHVESRSLSSFPLTKAQTDAKALRFAEEMEGKGWLLATARTAAPASAAEAATAAMVGEGETAALCSSSSSFDHHQVVLLSPAELVFALMPWRHAPTVDRLRRVLAHVDERVQLEEQHARLLQRFRKTTLRRLQELEDRARAAVDDDILEHHPFRPSDDIAASLPRHPVTLAVKQYLETHYGVGGGDGGGSQESSPAPIPTALAVSLSGGVDSMVLARLLVHFAPHNLAILALHLDYGNRAQSGQEAAYVERWCEEWGIAFRKRVVGEVTRGVTAREEYEAVARDIRYGFYREALAQHNCPAVLLGHHQGDVQENVLSNAMRGVGGLHLSGMGRVSTINGVSVHRPLLSLDKAAIIDFAHKFGVPYFKDTTPTWSTRGKLRRQLLPLLVDVYGEGVHRNLARLAAESDELRALVAARVLRPFWASVTHTPLAAYVACESYRGQSSLFWREALSSLLHDRGQAMLTDKGVSLLVRRLEECDPLDADTEVWCQLRKEYAVLLHGTGPTLFLFRPGAVRHWDQRPCAKEAEAALDAHLSTLTLSLDGPAPTRMGMWEVRALNCTDPGEEEEKEEELTTLEGFCRGRFCYSVLLSPCDTCDALPVLRVRGQQSKDSGGRGYKGLGFFQSLPLKIKRSIPVVSPTCPRCCDHDARGAAATTSLVGGSGGGGVGAAGGKRRVRVCYRFVGPAG